MDALSFLLGKKSGGGGGGTSNYNELSNKPQINSVELSGNKTLANLGIQSEITSTNKVDASFIDDSLSTNKFVTSAEKTTWNGKLDSSKVKNAKSTTSGDVYDVVYINNLVGDINTILDQFVTVDEEEY